MPVDVLMDREGVPTEQLMTTDLVTVSPETGVGEAVDILLEKDIGSLGVVDDDGSLVGVITSNDFLHVISGGDIDDDATIDAYMTEQVVTVKPDESIQTAAAKMITNGISHLPVEDDEEIVGMLSTTDITAYSVSRA
ncbi:CBS domain-containing protein [Haloarcula sp. 1CSR25-25]|uniref:CBS domain-containing protein n=1 Tax=Haloarcula sp. 1CSR25-25 TaxID=2862545 RepID=UPI002893F076|nr:CBS domain-containing protein [Haloarcula sp. 1CSR25-25]MDT3433298.1 CBS domain-containing protein [Haloarcula sp. 1CSR25-25]